MTSIVDFHVESMEPTVFDHPLHSSQAPQLPQQQPSTVTPAVKDEPTTTPTNYPQHQPLPSKSKHYMTIVQLIIQLTSPEKIDYDFASDLFLTYRSFISSTTLLKLLILRFRWALNCIDDVSHQERHIEGEKVLVRAFAVIRHWLLNYFKDDFASSPELKLLFINYFTKLSHSNFAVQRIITNLQKTYNDQDKSAINDTNDQSPQFRNSMIMNSASDKVIPNIPMQSSKRDPKLFLNPKNSNLRLSQAIEKSKDESPLFISLNKSPISRNVVTQASTFPTNSALSKIIPPTPVKKMEVIVKLPTPPSSASSQSSNNSKHEAKGLKSLIDKWTNTFKANKDTINKDVQVEKFMRRVVSVPKLNDKELEELIVGKFDILSARTIDEVEYLFKFQTELFSRHSKTVFGRDSFSFTIDEDINKSNIDNMNLFGYISNLSKSVVSLQQQTSERSYITYDSELSRNSASSREFNFESKDGDNENSQELIHEIKKVDTIEEFNRHFSGLSQSTRNVDIVSDAVIPEESKSGASSPKILIADPESIVPSEDIVISESKLKSENVEEPTAAEEEVEKDETSVTKECEEVESQTNKYQVVNKSFDEEVGESGEVELEISAKKHVREDLVEEASEVKEPEVMEAPGKETTIKEASHETSEETSSSETDKVIAPAQGHDFDFVNHAPEIKEVKTEDGDEDEIDDVVSLYSEDSPIVNTPTSTKFSVDRKSVLIRRAKKLHTPNSNRDSNSTFDSESFMSSYEEPIQDTMSSNNHTDTFNEPNTPPLHEPTPHVSPIKSITENQNFSKVNTPQPAEEIRLDLDRIPSFTRISNSSLNSVLNTEVVRSKDRESYLSQRSKGGHLSFQSDMISTSSIFTPIKGRKNIVNISVPIQQVIDDGDDEDEAELILQQKQKRLEDQVQRDVSLQTIESANAGAPFPGVSKKTLDELAGIGDESFHVDPINAALAKLEGTYTRGQRVPSSATSTTSSVLSKQVKSLNIHSNPNNKRRSFFIDQRRKTKQFMLTPVVQKDVSMEESSPRILLDLLMNYKITKDNLQISNSANHVSFILNYDSITLAKQFTLIEKDALLEIDWTELVEVKWNSEEVKQINSWLEILIQNEKLNGIDLCIARFNLTVNWIISEIILTKDLNLRKLTIQRFIHIAQNCKILQNYSTLAQILLALSSIKVQQLKDTWRNLEPGDILIYKNLEPIFSPEKNFLNLRTELNKMKPSLGAAPFLGLYLSDLIFNKEKKSVKDGMINFSKFQHNARIIKSLIKCIQWSMLYKIDVDEEVLSKCLYIKSLTEEEMNECLKDIQ